MDNSQENEDYWKAAGRMTFGMLTTAFSHPFDFASRAMQEEYLKNGTVSPKLRDVFSNYKFTTLYTGLGPRLMLAPLGGTLATYLYERFQRSFAPEY